MTREVVEAYSMASGSHGGRVSQPSVLFTYKKIEVMKKDVPRGSEGEGGEDRVCGDL